VHAAFEAMPKPENGKSVTPDDVKPMLAELVQAAFEAMPKPQDGASVTPDDVKPMLAELVQAAFEAMPKPENGKSVTPDDVKPMLAELVQAAFEAMPKPQDGKDGKLPVARVWQDKVHREGDVVTFEGGTWQAGRDTGKQPPHEDWICLAAAGKAGKSPRVRETYDPSVTDYAELDVVVLNGASFTARRDNPGPCPGAGWQMTSSQGKPGRPGEKQKGDPGPPGPKVERMEVDGQGLLTLVNADGSAVECDLYPVLAKIRG
jgi:hypothetical protein